MNRFPLYSPSCLPNNSTMRKLCLSTLLLIFPLLGLAREEKAYWQLDLLVFERPTHNLSGFAETWTFKPIEWPAELMPIDTHTLLADEFGETPLYVEKQARKSGIHIRSVASSRLTGAADKLARAGYQVLSQHSLRFAQKRSTPQMRLQGLSHLRLVARDTRSNSLSMMDYWLSAPDLDPPMDAQALFGWVRLDHQIHPILSFDLRLLKVLPGIFPNVVDPDGREEYYRDQVQQFRMREERRLRPGLTAYFDHQRLGMLARLSEIRIQAKPEEPESGS